MTEIAARLARPIQRLGRPSGVVVAVAVLVALLGAVLLARAYSLRDSVLPGVSVAGVDVGGLAPADARARIDQQIGERLGTPVEIVVGDKSIRVTPLNIFRVDGAASEQAAYDAARESVTARFGALAVPFAVQQEVEPVLRIHESGLSALADDLAAMTKRAISARVSMEGKDAVVVPGQAGTAIDEAAVLAQLEATALAGLPSFDVQLHTVEPPISTAAAERAATIARTIAAAPVTLALHGEGQIGQLGRLQLASLVRFEPKAGAVEVVLDPAGVERKLHPLVKPFAEKPVDATFSVSGDRAYLIKAKNGTTLDVKAAQHAIYEAGSGPGRRIAALGLATLEPELTTKEAKALGIHEQISTFTTDMGLSSPNRIWNVHLLGQYLDGTIVKAGETFSYNDVVGPRTIERGFREGQMIFGGVLIPSIGGGVCQTATTIFNTAFEAGLPVKERHNHSWYISHYPIGRDATVNWGSPDLKFKNDLDHALLIKTSYTDSTLTFTFYGMKQSRRVVTSTGPQENFTSPQPSYAYDPAAPKGSIRTVTGSHESGFDITVYRKVYERGKLIRKDSFVSHYVAVGDTIIYGPGTHPPRIDFVLPSI